jgi:hypothetical protein
MTLPYNSGLLHLCQFMENSQWTMSLSWCRLCFSSHTHSCCRQHQIYMYVTSHLGKWCTVHHLLRPRRCRLPLLRLGRSRLPHCLHPLPGASSASPLLSYSLFGTTTEPHPHFTCLPFLIGGMRMPLICMSCSEINPEVSLQPFPTCPFPLGIEVRMSVGVTTMMLITS